MAEGPKNNQSNVVREGDNKKKEVNRIIATIQRRQALSRLAMAYRDLNIDPNNSDFVKEYNEALNAAKNLNIDANNDIYKKTKDGKGRITDVGFGFEVYAKALKEEEKARIAAETKAAQDEAKKAYIEGKEYDSAVLEAYVDSLPDGHLFKVAYLIDQQQKSGYLTEIQKSKSALEGLGIEVTTKDSKDAKSLNTFIEGLLEKENTAKTTADKVLKGIDDYLTAKTAYDEKNGKYQKLDAAIGSMSTGNPADVDKLKEELEDRKKLDEALTAALTDEYKKQAVIAEEYVGTNSTELKGDETDIAWAEKYAKYVVGLTWSSKNQYGFKKKGFDAFKTSLNNILNEPDVAKRNEALGKLYKTVNDVCVARKDLEGKRELSEIQAEIDGSTTTAINTIKEKLTELGFDGKDVTDVANKLGTPKDPADPTSGVYEVKDVLDEAKKLVGTEPALPVDVKGNQIAEDKIEGEKDKISTVIIPAIDKKITAIESCKITIKDEFNLTKDSETDVIKTALLAGTFGSIKDKAVLDKISKDQGLLEAAIQGSPESYKEVIKLADKSVICKTDAKKEYTVESAQKEGYELSNVWSGLYNAYATGIGNKAKSVGLAAREFITIQKAAFATAGTKDSDVTTLCETKAKEYQALNAEVKRSAEDAFKTEFQSAVEARAIEELQNDINAYYGIKKEETVSEVLGENSEEMGEASGTAEPKDDLDALLIDLPE